MISANERQMKNINAYDGNVLIAACGPILSPADIGKRLIHLPEIAPTDPSTPTYILEHELAALWRLHIPTATGIALAQTVDVMIRQGYVHRRPSDPKTWQQIYEQRSIDHALAPIQLAAAVVGIAGTGKSTALERALNLKPQVIVHDCFPGLVGPMHQLLWIKIEVPGSGKIADLVESLVRATDAVLGTKYVEQILDGRRRSGATLAHEWLAKIGCHFLGLLALDEIQNLFKIQTKEVRKSAARNNEERPSLRIVDDEALKFVLTLTNSTKIPLIVCGTPEGIEAFSSRMSTSQRLTTAGVHKTMNAPSFNDPFFSKRLIPELIKYQWMPKHLALSDDLLTLLHNLSGGVLRICIALWIHAHRRAFARGATELQFQDFRYAAENALGTLRPSVLALLSNDPRRWQLYQDLLPSEAF